MASEPLVCPSCATTHELDQRFCRNCGMPLVYAGPHAVGTPITERHERARKIKPQYAEGELVQVAGAQNQTEAEFIQGLLLEEGVPSVVRRARGFDVPDFLAAGPRSVMVPQSGVATARDVLLQADVISGEAPAQVAAARLALFLFGGLALLALIVWASSQLG